MNAIKTARRLLKHDPTSESSKTLASLVMALESETDSSFKLAGLYELDLKSFELAMAILHEWRIDRYYAKKAKLFDLSRQVHGLDAVDAAPGAPADTAAT